MEGGATRKANIINILLPLLLFIIMTMTAGGSDVPQPVTGTADHSTLSAAPALVTAESSITQQHFRQQQSCCSGATTVSTTTTTSAAADSSQSAALLLSSPQQWTNSSPPESGERGACAFKEISIKIFFIFRFHKQLRRRQENWRFCRIIKRKRRDWRASDQRSPLQSPLLQYHHHHQSVLINMKESRPRSQVWRLHPGQECLQSCPVLPLLLCKVLLTQ